MLLLGDCLEQMKTLADNSVDAVVTDPPYGLSFMGKKWDYDVPSVDVWREVFRVLKPGGHVLSFGGTRTYHRLACNIEDAGFEIRDQVAWLYGQGFPKSTNVLKSGLKQGLFCGCKTQSESQMPHLPDASVSAPVSIGETEVNSLQSSLSEQNLRASSDGTEPEKSLEDGKKSSMEGRSYLQAEQGQLHRPEIREMSERVSGDVEKRQLHNGASSSDGETSQSLSDSNRSSTSQRSQYSKQLHNESRIIPKQSGAQTCGSCGKAICDEGLGSALKPSIEPICLARKPLEKGLTLAENVLKWGTGAINVDGCRIEGKLEGDPNRFKKTDGGWGVAKFHNAPEVRNEGRWPANVLFDEDAASVLDAQSIAQGLGRSAGGGDTEAKDSSGNWFGKNAKAVMGVNNYNDKGGASRFFYVAKASKRERNAGLEGMPEREPPGSKRSTPAEGRSSALGAPRANFHPTVKPTRLMEYLITLITPPNGTILDPFAGSGSTLVAAKQLGFNFIGIERDPEYFEIAKKRIGE